MAQDQVRSGMMYSILEDPPELKEAKVLMSFIAASIDVIRSIVSESVANGIATAIGRNVGKSFAEGIERTNDIGKAITVLMNVCPGVFEKYEATRPDNGIYLVARECVIRQISERENIPWGGTLCHLRRGIIWSFLEHVTNRKLKVDIVKPGYYGCLLSLTSRDGNEVEGRWEVKVPSEDEYTRKALDFLHLLFESVIEVINRVIGPAAKAYLKKAGYNIGLAHGSILQQTESLEDAGKIISKYIGFCELEIQNGKVTTNCFDRFKGLARHLMEGFLEGLLNEVLNKKS